MEQKNYEHVSLKERLTIWKCARLGYSLRRIGREIGKDPSTIQRELKRNANDGEDWMRRAHQANELACRRRTEANESRTRLGSIEIQEYIEERLKKKWSPLRISIRIGKSIAGASISYEAIYQWIRDERPDLVQYLIICGKSRRRRRGKKQYKPKQPAAPKTSIDERPEEINNRTVVGHWEGDLMVSRKSTAVLLHLRERKTRFSKLVKLPDAKAETIKWAMIKILGALPGTLVMSITLDNGSENALHDEIALELLADVYFCHAYHAWEKGAVEYGNSDVRKDLPKGTDFALISDEEIQAIEDRMNTTPMLCLNAFTPAEAMREALFACCH